MSHSVISADLPLLTRSGRTKKSISLTALIDVVFILLMFFMLTSTFIKWRKVELQTAAAGDNVVNEQEQPEPQLIIIRARTKANVSQSSTKQGREFSLLSSTLVNGKHEQKFTRLADLIAQLDPAIATVILPEPDVEVQTIINSLMQLKEADLVNVTLGNTLGDSLSTDTTIVQSE
ncbi:MAG: biopolymer transporter ExbD [Colwellia sp.]|nr:biopolymer transporter ExbD [Colwellia sp.]